MVSMVYDFAKQFVGMEEENARLRAELAAAKKLVVDAHLKVDALEKDNAKLKKSLDKEVEARESDNAAIAEKEVRLRQAIESLLGKFSWINACIHDVAFIFLGNCLNCFTCLTVAADIPVDRTGHLRVESLQDSIAFAIDSADKLKDLFGKTKSALTKLYSQILTEDASSHKSGGFDWCVLGPQGEPD